MALKKLMMAVFCSSSLSAWAANPQCSAGKKTEFKFEWQPEVSLQARAGRVLVKDTAGKIVQTLEGLENFRETSESLGTGRDFNNDGCPDLVVTSGLSGIGNETVTVFLYNPRTRRFEKSKRLSNLGGLDVDPRDKNCVTGSWKTGADSFHFERHCWLKGRLVLMSEEKDSAVLDSAGRLQCYRHVQSDYRDGKKRTRTNCTKEM